MNDYRFLMGEHRWIKMAENSISKLWCRPTNATNESPPFELWTLYRFCSFNIDLRVLKSLQPFSREKIHRLSSIVSKSLPRVQHPHSPWPWAHGSAKRASRSAKSGCENVDTTLTPKLTFVAAIFCQRFRNIILDSCWIRRRYTHYGWAM